MEPQLFLKQFGQHVKNLRLEKNISIQEMAKTCSISELKIVQLEDGQLNSSLPLLMNIADALEVELHELFVSNA
ncbi:helix-turn-helix domain-containing protein [Fulvivirga sp. 29W222]|uniref:Helix-turn-helix domain-containing protein n=1 Tax=Fulvivirga marina TaxID=2494733 RepID=A0A937KF77_9BACT|nr:helix-turn-helix domain-containing protein [Fulvivirga marina]MBL6447965.1 helix-turn-helix domain-containing protein [Fulvivirga marina]